MENPIRHEQLERALKACGASWDAAQAHGLLSGRLAVGGPHRGVEWLSQVLEGTDAGNALRAECESMLHSVFDATHRQLAGRESDFEPMLPEDDEVADARASALAHWCEGFLHGLVSSDHNDAIRQRLAAEPLAEIIKDLLQITRAVADEERSEADESAYAELVEYLRVAAQLAYEELGDLREPHQDDPDAAGPKVLH